MLISISLKDLELKRLPYLLLLCRTEVICLLPTRMLKKDGTVCLDSMKKLTSETFRAVAFVNSSRLIIGGPQMRLFLMEGINLHFLKKYQTKYNFLPLTELKKKLN